MDLTPFAGILSDGESHTVGVSVFNANSYFLATANLLLYTDHGRKHTGGGLLENTLSAAPTPQVTENLQTDSSGNTTGTVSVLSTRNFATKGYVDTSHGRVETTVAQTVDFSSVQTFDVGANDIQNAVQKTTVSSKTSVKDGFLVETTERNVSYPFVVDYAYIVNADGSSYQSVTSSQQDIQTVKQSLNGFPFFEASETEQVKSSDTLDFDASGDLTAIGPTKSSASFVSKDSLGQCYSRTLESETNVLTSVKDGAACPSHR